MAAIPERHMKTALRKAIGEMLVHYDGVRHMGTTPSESAKQIVGSLSFEKTERWVRATMQLWNVVIAHYQGQPMNDLDDFTDIQDAIAELNQWHPL